MIKGNAMFPKGPRHDPAILFHLSEIITSHNNAESLKEKIVNNRFDWLKIIEWGNRLYLLAAIYYALKEKNLFQYIDEQGMEQFLEEIYRKNRERNLAILEQLKEIADTLAEHNITPLFLKGSASLVEGDYPDIGIRYLSDIDFMVEEDHIDQTLQILIDIGYYKVDEPSYHVPDDFYHLFPHEKTGMPAFIEIHRRSGEHLSIPWSAENSTLCSNPDFHDVAIFTPQMRVYHAFIHTEIDDANFYKKEIDLRHLHDFVVLVQVYKDAIDWDALCHQAKSDKVLRQLEAYLFAGKTFFHLETPLHVDTPKTQKHLKKILYFFSLIDTWYDKYFPLYKTKVKLINRFKQLKQMFNQNA